MLREGLLKMKGHLILRLPGSFLLLLNRTGNLSVAYKATGPAARPPGHPAHATLSPLWYHPCSLHGALAASGYRSSRHSTRLAPFHLLLSAKCYKLKNAFPKCISVHAASQDNITLTRPVSLKTTRNLLVRLFPLVVSVPTSQRHVPLPQTSYLVPGCVGSTWYTGQRFQKCMWI